MVGQDHFDPQIGALTYEQHLTSATGGRGSYHMEYSHYDEVPAHLQTKIIASAKAERAGHVPVGLSLEEMERKLKAKAAKMHMSKERTGAYVYGTMRKTGWKPEREKKSKR